MLYSPAWEGESSFQATYAVWKELSVSGRYRMNAKEYSKANKKTGSSFNEPMFYFLCVEQNCGIMHDPAGHITHFMNNVSNCIREKMKGCAWQKRLYEIDGQVMMRIAAVTMDKKTSDCLDESRGIERRIRKIRKQKKSCLIRAD